MPEWLLEDWSGEDAGFPLEDLLRDSLYYPASGVDGSPVELFSGMAHSFIYSDYMLTVGKVRASMGRTINPHIDGQGFAGYRQLFSRDIAADLLVPNRRALLQLSETDVDSGIQVFTEADDDHDAPRCGVCYYYQRLSLQAVWSVYERLDNFDEDYGAKRFSLLSIRGDASALYQMLYTWNRIDPQIVYISLFGLGYGGNWTNFYKEGMIFCRSLRTRRPNFIYANSPLLEDWQDFSSIVVDAGAPYLWERSDDAEVLANSEQNDAAFTPIRSIGYCPLCGRHYH